MSESQEVYHVEASTPAGTSQAAALIADLRRVLGTDERKQSYARSAELLDSHAKLFPPTRAGGVTGPLIDVIADLRQRLFESVLMQAAARYCRLHDRWNAIEQDRAERRAAMIAATAEYDQALERGDEAALVEAWARQRIAEHRLQVQMSSVPEQQREMEQNDLQGARRHFWNLWQQYAAAMEAYYSQPERGRVQAVGDTGPFEYEPGAAAIEREVYDLIGEMPARQRKGRR